MEEQKTVKLELRTEEMTEKGQGEEDLVKKVGELEELLRQTREALAEAPSSEQVDGLNKVISELQAQLDEKNSVIDAVNKERDDARWSLGEHKQWLTESNNKVSDLENLLKDKDNELHLVIVELEEHKAVKVKVSIEEMAEKEQKEQNLQKKIEELDECFVQLVQL